MGSFEENFPQLPVCRVPRDVDDVSQHNLIDFSGMDAKTQ